MKMLLAVMAIIPTIALAGVVPLSVDTGSTMSPHPVSTGIPFPRGELTSLAQLKLVDAAQTEVPAQFSALCKWPDNSLKSLLVSFNASVSSSARTQYYLHYGPGISRANYTTALSHIEDSSAITVTTGPLRFRLSKSSFTLFDQVYVDRNNNSTFEDSERIIDGGGSLFFTSAVDNQTYVSSLYPRPTFVLEESGPLQIVIRVNGKLRSVGGQDLTDFRVWIHAYAGQEQVKLDYTLVDSRPDPDVEHPPAVLPLCAKAYGLYLPYKIPGASYTFGGESNAEYTGASAGTHFLYQAGSFTHVDGELRPFTFAYAGAGTGARAPGWMDVSGTGGGIGIAVRNFWQQFPKEFLVADSAIVVYLHPDISTLPTPDVSYPALTGANYTRPNTFYFPRYGGAKTYQILFSFHAGDAKTGQIAARNRNFQLAYPLVMAPSSWYTSSGVFGDLNEAGPSSAGFDQYLIDGIYTPSVTNKPWQSLVSLYGWRDFGDRLRPGWCQVSAGGTKMPGFYNDTHVGATNFIKQYLRTMDKRWWELGETATRHFMDIDVAHCNRKGYWDQKGAAWGSLGPGECNMTKHEMVDHDDRNLHFGHAHLSGLADYYLLTGDRRALEVAREIGDWWTKMSPLAFATPVANPHIAEAERDYAWPLFTMNEAYRATGDVKYLQAAAQEVNHLLGWWKTPSAHYVNGAVVGQNNYAEGTGWWYMYPRCDNSPAPPPGAVLYNGTNPWMAGPLFSSLIQFYQYNVDLRLVDGSEIKEMLLQTVEYVVKYGWNQTRKHQPYDYFVYSEAVPETDGGKSHLLYPAICAWLTHSLGGLAHPEWYTTSPKWLTIPAEAYLDWKTVKYRGTTELGFYGYEIIFPLDFFSIMSRLDNNTLQYGLGPIGRSTNLTVRPMGSSMARFSVTLPESGYFSLRMYDVRGRRVWGYDDQGATAGSHLIQRGAGQEATLPSVLLIMSAQQSGRAVTQRVTIVK